MICSLPRIFYLAIALMGATSVLAQGTAPEPSAESAQQLPPESVGGDTATTETHEHGSEDGHRHLDELPEGYEEELSSRLAKFQEVREKLEQALTDQRVTRIRYSNKEDRSPAAREKYLQQRQTTRAALDDTYQAALDVTRLAFDKECATFVLTMIQHRLGTDIYDASTLEGATRLIDAGSNFTYLFQAAVRCAIVEGRFDLARRLYKVLNDDNKEDIDRTLEFHLPQMEEQFESEQAVRQREDEEDRLPRVKLRTTQGDVVLELFMDQAPSTVSHFIGLVEQGFYDEMDFYQVIDHLLAITGDRSGDGMGNCGKFLVDEHQREDARNALRGSVVMAKIPMGDTGKFVPNSASSQFAIFFLPVVSVPESQTVFGRVIEGMDAISRLRRVDPNKEKKKSEVVQPPDRIIEATVIRRPETLPEPQYVQFGRP